MKCRQCGKEFEPDNPARKFCSVKCCQQNRNRRQRTGEPPPRGEPFEFICAHCGKHVENDGYHDKRFIYCSRRCHDRAKEQRKASRKRHRGDNLGMSGGMSLRSLIRRERRSLD